ncbi:MAG: hypothetical protein NW224_10840 [Leptolyngbyaceae cyanobacterium bins.302]|nr:hypothetical protein [Leptolyngbyaceae cyanobacterium bins.302]
MGIKLFYRSIGVCRLQARARSVELELVTSVPIVYELDPAGHITAKKILND